MPANLPPLDSKQMGEAIRAFRAIDCPACGVEKDLINDPFCDTCMGLLPPDLLEQVCDKGTFLETFHTALALIKARSGSGPREGR